MTECNVVFITDENYAMPTGVAMVSLIRNFSSRYSLIIYVICDEVSEETKQKLLKCKEVRDTDVDIVFIDADNAWDGPRAELDSVHISRAAMIKFRIPVILERVNRVLFLDSDLIVEGDISGIFEYDIDDVYLASVEDMDPSRMNAEGISHVKRISLPVDRYFNSGVMYLNTEKMRKDDITAKLYEDKKNNPDHGFMDQDSLNYVLCKKRLELPWKYNFMAAYVKNLDIDGLNRYFNREYICTDEYLDEAVVLHYAGDQKPWIMDVPYTTSRFIKYYRMSPYRDNELRLRSYIRELEKLYDDLYMRTNFLRKPKRWIMKLFNRS